MKDVCQLGLACVTAAIVTLSAGGASAAEYEDVQVTDPFQLEEMGFPPDAQNVYQRHYFFSEESEDTNAASGGFGPTTNYSTWAGRSFPGRDGTYQRRLRAPSEELYCSGGGSFDSETAEQEFSLPNGARITGIRWWAYDTSDSEDVELRIWQFCQPPFGSGNPVNTNLTPDSVQSSGISFDGGQYSDYFSLVHTFDATGCLYFFQANTDTCTSDLALGKIRIQWERQVSPPPAYATFPDVPVGSEYHQVVEALVRTGVPVNCGSGEFCPNAVITRGQLADMVVRLLGLHWN